MTSTVILGTGIIGVSIAYYLSDHQPGSTIHLVEPSPRLFASASGFAGGFLAKDWFSVEVAGLGKLSFEEHRKLAEEGDGREKWGYSLNTSFSHAPAPPAVRGKKGEDWLREGTSRADAAGSVGRLSGKSPIWLKRAAGDHVEVIAEQGTTAQV
jgi:glycine/D-amino acid oxidase-like deaminating enzyme